MALFLLVDVPFASFRIPSARGYRETHEFPPPSTVFGFLLSLVGEHDKSIYGNIRFCIGQAQTPEKNVQIRKLWRLKTMPYSDSSNQVPDFVEYLSNVQLVIGIEEQSDEEIRLCSKIRLGLASPKSLLRTGNLSLGESRDLVNSIKIVDHHTDKSPYAWLVSDRDGIHHLSVYTDYSRPELARFGRYGVELSSCQMLLENPHFKELAWIAMSIPAKESLPDGVKSKVGAKRTRKSRNGLNSAEV